MFKPRYSMLWLSMASQLALADDAATPPQGIERYSVIGSDQRLSANAGSVTLIDELTLEKYEYDDIARILATVPGVNIRVEDGYGLRPNIGFRGVTPERSKKINILEDGVLIGPAPYSAPAAYYFPMMSRMTAVEVTKGPGAIQYGPNTVAGTLNLVTRPLPAGREGGLDLSLGTDSYGKAHGYYGDSLGDFSYLLEGLHVQTEGFKELDGGGDTGFEKNDLMAKLGWDRDSGDIRQRLELKLAYADETSDETYLGLTDADFAATPYRRYAASQLARMDWEHSQVMLSHHLETDSFNLTTRLYRNDFERSWFKLNGFASSQGGQVPSLQEVLQEPGNELYQPYYQVLTGTQDSGIREILVLGDNAREYYSQGLQLDLGWSLAWGSLTHELEAGTRIHQDQIERNHTEDHYLMRSGRLESTGEETLATTTDREETQAISVYLQDRVRLGDWTLTLGIRGEHIEGDYQNRAPGQEQNWQSKTHRIWLPGASVFYDLTGNSGLLFGVHKGFVPTSPLQDVRIRPEESVNYEAGWRYASNGTRAELIGFFNDIENLKESCSFSTSASCVTQGNLDQDYNGGAVDIYGLEASVQSYVKLNGELTLPWSLVYTHTQGEFKTDLDSDFEMWGQIQAGDELPYLPDNVLTLSFGLSANRWQVSVLINYLGEMKEAAGEGVTLSGVTVDAHTLVDLSASYELDTNSTVYIKVDNLFDEAEIASRRPYGARPTKPQQAFLGYKYRF
ncbi:TonB-dependent receptor family protein [Bowmanella dokdonensis]|uniref:TonB-dependent receptor n=1 Tax=Bowmanella dokdonensis TaxID=751969 RepID=A0A939DRX7_9ALTE|nr:TonB-dependent receptor [Bowmanella dokdonensis]MBN7826796.1 TonB-dependent receptor [Bowmanella dokdonensis]